MPLYEYGCSRGHRFEVIRPIDRRHDPIRCSICRELAHLLMSVSTFAINFNSMIKKFKPEAAPNDSGYHPKWDKFTP